MRHDWIFDVLSDLQAYADLNGLPDLARNLRAVLAEARGEVAAAAGEAAEDAGATPRCLPRAH